MAQQVDGRWAYTLAEAATELKTTTQWVGQLLKRDSTEGKPGLDGPPASSAAGNYSTRNAPRVWKDSVDAYLANNPKGETTTRRRDSSDPTSADITKIRDWVEGQERRLRAAALELKVTADHYREQLDEERQHRRDERRHLMQMVVDSAAVVGALTNYSMRSDDACREEVQRYSDALTQLLAFDDSEDIQGRD